MPLVFDDVKVDHSGHVKIATAEITGPSSYATGGEDLRPLLRAMTIKTVRTVQVEEQGTHWCVFVPATKLLMYYVNATEAQAAGSADLSALVTRVTVIGT